MKWWDKIFGGKSERPTFDCLDCAGEQIRFNDAVIKKGAQQSEFNEEQLKINANQIRINAALDSRLKELDRIACLRMFISSTSIKYLT